nr:MAG TPA: hypothetical protein [Caudoviricetes sp.]
MKNINHNYWTAYKNRGEDADLLNPDLRNAMNQLYEAKGFDFGKIENGVLRYASADKRFHCSPDAYSTYTSLTDNYIKAMPFRSAALSENKQLSEELKAIAGTVAGELFFPCHSRGLGTINQNRGTFKKISDRIDLTLLNIKYFYDKSKTEYPLKETLEQYAYFFHCFADFQDYIAYNFLQDFCDGNGDVSLWKDKNGLPENEKELISFWQWSLERLQKRLNRINQYAIQNGLFDNANL